MKKHTMHANMKYFELLKNGRKKYEFRLNDEKRRNISIGDLLEIRCAEDKNNVFNCKVVGITKGLDFEGLLKEVNENQIGGIGKEQQIIELNVLYSAVKIKNYGVIAIELGAYD